MQQTTTIPVHCFKHLTSALIACVLLVTSAGVAAEPLTEVGLLASDDDPGSLQATRRLAERLGARGVRVHEEKVLRARLEGTRVDPAESGRVPAGLTESITRGIRQFFYQSRRDAVETLRDAVDSGLSHLPALARRPDLVDQVFEAGIVLVRAARITEAPGSSGDTSTSLALETVHRLATHFPTRTPSMETAPPEIVELFEQAHAEIDGLSTRLQLEISDPGCTGVINGVATREPTVAVAPGVRYFLRLECERDTSQLRAVTLGAGQTRVLPMYVGDISPLSSEGQMQRLLAWSGMDTILTVGQRGRGASRRTRVTVFRVNGGQTSVVQEGRFDPDACIDEAFDLGSSLPERVSTDEVPMDDGGGPMLDIGLVAGGGVSMAASTWLLVAASKNHRLLRCSANAADPLPGSRCQGASTRGVTLSESETSDREKQINRQRILGITLGAVGVAGATWGLVRILAAPDPQATDPQDRATTQLIFTTRSASLVVTF